MIAMVISFFLSHNASALELSLNSPGQVEINEEFSVLISADSDENFDVKIFVHKSESDKIPSSDYISEIYSEDKESWSNPWYYLQEVFPEKTEYKIKVTESPGNQQICLRLRKSSVRDSGFEQICQEIKITGEEQTQEEQTPVEEEIQEEKETVHEEEIEIDLSDASEEIKPLSTNSNENEKILLNSKQSQDQDEPQVLKTKQGKNRTWIIYAFTSFCVVLIILLALRKL
ncbi:MAG: hypothetical protein KJ600_04565 [Nanoarchaeota archaeon]|nr:hypothetical protein [Nanoarchaeota archaeon]MBU1103801.1 hypothetical protein [Nanoarchaeota archaeon]